MISRHNGLRVVLLDSPAPDFPNPLTQTFISQQGNDSVCKRRKISLMDDISVDIVLDDLGHSSHIGHNDRASRRESFEHRQAERVGGEL
jgi:hypothetical protein